MREPTLPLSCQVPSPSIGMVAPFAVMDCISGSLGFFFESTLARADKVKTARRRYASPEAPCPLRLRLSAGLLENLPPDQHAADFAGAGADLIELGVAQQPPAREVVDVAIAAETLDRFKRHERRALRRVENGAGRILARGAPVVASLGDR